MNGDRSTHPESMQKPEASTASCPSYQPPRIVTHSADELRETSQQVNACTSYDPGADPP